MDENVKICVKARTDFFGTYLTIPPQLQPQVDQFIAQINALGEQSADSAAFEQQFVATGLQDTFNSLITGCTPQAHTMTREEKAFARQTAKEIFAEDKDRILKEAGEELLDTVAMKAESELRTRRRQEMIDAGVLDDYTRATNVVEDAGIIGRFFKGKFGKKKG